MTHVTHWTHSMKKREKQSLRGMSESELVKHTGALEAEITKAKLEGATKQQKNVRIFRVKRERIAVVKTILSIRHL